MTRKSRMQMPDKVTKILYGCVLEDMPKCPRADGSWVNWMRAIHLDNSQPVEDRGGRGLHEVRVLGMALDQPYVSKPAWVGIRIDVLKYGDVWVNGHDDTKRAMRSWMAFMNFVKVSAGLVVPPGQLIVCHDE